MCWNCIKNVINSSWEKFWWIMMLFISKSLFTFLISYWKKVDTHAILCHLVKSLNYVVYEHILIKRVTEEVERMLTAINVNKVFTQSLTLILLHFIEAARTSLLNIFTQWDYICWLSLTTNIRWLNTLLRI